MSIAEVIVDVPSNQTDRPFDYAIPDQWTTFIKPGMRVVVPFGPRKIQGFVVRIKEKSEHKKLKNISTVLDLSPVLTTELLQLGFWLTEKTLCYAISAFQVMLPAAMKVKYEKEIRVSSNASLQELPEQVMRWFRTNDVVKWNEIEKEKHDLPFFQKAMTSKQLDVIYKVKDRATKKSVKMIAPIFTDDDQAIEMVSKQATKQYEVLEYFISNREPIPLKDLLETLQTTSSPVKSLIKKGLLQEQNQEVYRDPYENRNFKKTESLPLSQQQQIALSSIMKPVDANNHDVFLLYGITGSGKTEVYLQAIDAVLKKGQEAIVLVPEIALTPQMVHRFKGRFGPDVAVLHSGLSTGEKYDEWRKIQRKEVKVVVGARSAIFAPFENLGMIIIDEEHESSYKQEENPRYHARDVAIYRGKKHSCPVVLGSATPSLETFARAKKDVYTLLTMDKRINEQKLPSVEIVDLREELRSGNRSMFSEVLFAKMKDRLEKKQQTVLFLNRRGFSTFVMCRDCGLVMECPHCDISLTYHKRSHTLKCHYCAHETQMPTSCPECTSEHIRFFGTGTQKVEEELTKVLPEARIIRMDVDTTRKKGSHEKLLKTFGEGNADILLGTQMIAKGLDFPNVTLVGVLAADTMLHIPDFRSAEKTFQLLTQVSGRAGRHKLPGEVVIQTYTPEHYSIECASIHHFELFFQQEMNIRRNHQYPPYYYLTLVTVSHQELMKAVSVTEKITDHLRHSLSNQCVILGPVASPIARIKDRYRYQCMIKYKNEPNLIVSLQKIMERYKAELKPNHLQISIDMNPHMLM